MRRALATALALVPLFAACGDDITSNTLSQIIVEVDGLSVNPDDASFFGQALQTVVGKEVTVLNGGGRKLRIDGIDWATDEATGARLKNQYVEIDWRGSVDADSFPYEVDVNNNNRLSFVVEYTPPLGKPLDDFSESVLLIKTNAFNDSGTEKLTEFRVHFTMRQDSAIPRVTPDRYTFTNATQARGETQEFRIYNDPDLATTGFTITNVYLETPSQEFTLQAPSQGTPVLAPGAPGYADVVFKVTYQPKDDVPDANAVIIQTDVGSGGTLRVPLSSATTVGDFSVTYSHPNELDFTNVTARETRSVQVTCDGPGTMTIKQPRIEPDEAKQDYTLKAWVPATTAGGTDTEITSWPRGVNVGRAIRFDIEYAPSADGDTANGELVIPYDNPSPGELRIALLSGEPKSKIVLAPKTEIVSVTGSVQAGDAGTRKVVVYNEGNGPLEVKNVIVKAEFDLPPKVWSLVEPFAPFQVAPGGLEVIEVAYDLGEITDNDGRQVEYLEVTYADDFLGSDQPKTMGLAAEESQGKANPVASLAGGSGAVVGQPVTITGSATAANGQVTGSAYIYYLVAKPAGSTAKLNVQAGTSASFVPDVAGAYTFEMFAYAQDGNLYLYSAPSSLTVQVAP